MKTVYVAHPFRGDKERNREKAKDVLKLYGEHFGKGCSKSLSCVDVCPMKIPTLASMAKLNGGKV